MMLLLGGEKQIPHTQMCPALIYDVHNTQQQAPSNNSNHLFARAEEVSTKSKLVSVLGQHFSTVALDSAHPVLGTTEKGNLFYTVN